VEYQADLADLERADTADTGMAAAPHPPDGGSTDLQSSPSTPPPPPPSVWAPKLEEAKATLATLKEQFKATREKARSDDMPDLGTYVQSLGPRDGSGGGGGLNLAPLRPLVLHKIITNETLVRGTDYENRVFNLQWGGASNANLLLGLTQRVNARRVTTNHDKLSLFWTPANTSVSSLWTRLPGISFVIYV